jgi:hypothetical protein
MAWEDVKKWKRRTAWISGTTAVLAQLMLEGASMQDRLLVIITYGWPAVAVLIHERAIIFHDPNQDLQAKEAPRTEPGDNAAATSPPAPVESPRPEPPPVPPIPTPPVPNVIAAASNPGHELVLAASVRGVRLPDACPICDTWPRCTRPGDAHAEDPAV